MPKIIKGIPLLLFCIILWIGSFAQSRQINGEDGILYVVTDKTLYLPGETIWFSGLLLPVGRGDTSSYKADILSVALLRQDTIGYTLKKNYLVEADVCTGSLNLPNDLMPGNYELVAALNLVDSNDRPYYSFRKALTIKSPLVQPFRIIAETDTTKLKDTILVRLQASLGTGRLPGDKKATITSKLYGAKPFTQELPETGIVLLKVPKNSIDKMLPILYTNTTINGYSRPFSIWLSNSAVPAVIKSPVFPVESTVITIQCPLVKDTLTAILNTLARKNIRMVTSTIHGQEADTSVTFTVNGSKKIIIPLHTFSKGIHQLTAIDEQGKALAFGRFYAHYQNEGSASIEPYQKTYGLREKVKIAVQIAGKEGKPQQGIFTFRCVNISRMEKKNQVHLPAYYTAGLNARINDRRIDNAPPAKAEAAANPDLKPASDIVLKKLILGTVFKSADSSAVRKPFAVLFRKGDQTSYFYTDSAGNFRPDARELVVKEGSLFSMMVAKKERSKDMNSYSINLIDPMASVMSGLQAPQLLVPGNVASNQTDSILQFKNKYEGNQLETVVIKGRRSKLESDFFYGNQCGDFVGPCKILNCFVHVGDKNNTIPVKGEEYWMRLPDNKKQVKVIYSGCIANKLNVIYVSREFKGLSEKRLQSNAETIYLSTLCWEPSFIINGRKELEFYTSDLPGTYKIILEGINELGEIIYQENEIVVESKK